MDETAFAADRRTLDAVLRNLAVIGEAARHVPEELRSRFREVPWIDMADMRNVVVHEYFGVDVQILWQTAAKDVPEMLVALEAVAVELDREPDRQDGPARHGR